MNVRTNFYGAIGLASTIGKNGFAAGQSVSNGSQWFFQKTRENLIELKMDLAVVGEVKVIENLEKASKWSGEKCESATAKFQEWETSTWQNYEESKNQDELNEDWRKFNNQPTKLEKVYNLAKKVGDKVSELTNRLLSPVVKISQKKWQQYSTKFFNFYFCSN